MFEDENTSLEGEDFLKIEALLRIAKGMTEGNIEAFYNLKKFLDEIGKDTNNIYARRRFVQIDTSLLFTVWVLTKVLEELWANFGEERGIYPAEGIEKIREITRQLGYFIKETFAEEEEPLKLVVLSMFSLYRMTAEKYEASGPEITWHSL